jgi:hypothetical protein
MARRIFHSFRHANDYWRVQTIRQIGAIEGQKLLNPNDWEAVKKKGDGAIQKWIDEQLYGRSCVVVLIGSATTGRRWIKYEMKKGWDDGKGVVGIHIHGLKDANRQEAYKGRNPLAEINVQTRTGVKTLSNVAKTYDPPYTTSTSVFDHIKNNIDSWIEEAIRIRKAN